VVDVSGYDLYLQGREAASRGDRARAIGLFDEALAADGSLAEAYAALARALAAEQEMAGDIDAALHARMTQAAGLKYTPSPEFRLRVEQSIGSKRKSRLALGWAPKLGLAAAALVLVAAVSGLWVRSFSRDQALTEIADLHVTALASANPVDVVSSDRHTVKPWFQGKLPFTFNLPELENSPFKLIGGRVTYLRRQPAAHLLFELRKHQFSVFILQDQPGLPFLLDGAARHLAFNCETWTAGSLRYFVVSDAAAADVHDLSELLRRAARS
jgi:anti-sigma factor RsiW